MLPRDEARGALVLALEARPLEAWIARELALTLARLEYRAGYVRGARIVRERLTAPDTALGSRRAARAADERRAS